MDGELVERWRVFLASPGDVGEERAAVREFLQNVLPHQALLHGRMTFELVSWDDPHHGTTMPAHLTPQQAVTRFHGEPASCQIVLVILWSRMGTHLDVSRESKPDGTPFLSGTEWEYLNAFDASPRPEILVYRRMDPAPGDLDDPDLNEKVRQRQLVATFFQRFTNPDGSARGGFQPYRGLDGFRQRLAADLERLVAEHLKRRQAAVSLAQAPPAPEPAPVLPPARCFGRGAETDALIDALTAPGDACLLVLGSAGIGKTTLTRRVAADPAVTAHFGARRFFVPLETATDAATLRTAIIQAIGLNPASTSFTAALATLAGKPGLLVLDNLETPWEPDQAATQDVLLALAGTSGVNLLASLRGAAAPASPRWTARPTRVGALSASDARRLFLEVAPEAESDPVHLAHFLTALGGVPLAVELVALRADGGARLAELWTEWQRRGVALAEHPDQDPGRLTSLGRSLDLSWASRRLREPGRMLFRLLGALPAGMADADRLALLGPAASEAARQLCVVGLAFQRDGRLDLLPPVRDYARAAQPVRGDEAELWCGHYLALVGETGEQIFRAEGAAALARLTPEVANIIAAFVTVVAAARRDQAMSSLSGLNRLLSATGAGALTPLTELAEACHAAEETWNEAECYYRLGEIALSRYLYDQARSALETAQMLFRRLNAVRDETYCIKRLGDIAFDRSDLDAARAAYEQALPLYREVGDFFGEANCIKGLGDIARRHSDHDAARTAYEQALPLYRRVGEVNGEGNCYLELGRLARALHDTAGARARFLEALAVYQRVRVTHNCAIVLEDLARVTTGTERDEYIMAARSAWTEIGLPDQIARLDRQFG